MMTICPNCSEPDNECDRTWQQWQCGCCGSWNDHESFEDWRCQDCDVRFSFPLDEEPMRCPRCASTNVKALDSERLIERR
jgi:hypothetical protein